jgi:thiamine kinase-like enzyme
MNTHTRQRLEALLGASITSFHSPKCGYTPALRFVCQADHGSAFAKVGTDPFSTEATLKEIEVYDTLSLSCMPRLLASEASAEAPILIIEDLSRAHWPVPWREGDLEQVVEAIGEIHRTPLSDEVRERLKSPPGWPGWREVAQAPEEFLASGLASEAWLDQALPVLIDAATRCPVDGDDLVHHDLRSDNMCIGADGVRIIDWSWTDIGNADLDLAFFLNAVTSEGGPPQEVHFPDAPAQAAVVSGFFGSQCVKPVIPTAAHVRTVQLQQFRAAFAWVTRALDLPPSP